MIFKTSYYIKRDGKNVWLSMNASPLPNDEIIEERMIAVASEGKVLAQDGEIVGKSCWVKDPENIQLMEIDEPEEEEDQSDENE